MPMRAADVRAGVAVALAEHKPRHLVHVGAHEGEEVPGYLAAGIKRITLVEPIPHLAERLRRRWPDLRVVQVACSDREDVATLTVPRRSNLAGLHTTDGEQVSVFTRRLDVIAPDADAAVVDVQGHELTVLSAAPWESLRVVVVETCTIDDPEIAPLHETVVDFMAGRGFSPSAEFARPYDFIQRWGYGRVTDTGAEVRDVVFARA
jgi:FkbM family methyltransferase